MTVAKAEEPTGCQFSDSGDFRRLAGRKISDVTLEFEVMVILRQMFHLFFAAYVCVK